MASHNHYHHTTVIKYTAILRAACAEKTLLGEPCHLVGTLVGWFNKILTKRKGGTGI